MRLRSPSTHLMRDMLLRTLRMRRGLGISRLQGGVEDAVSRWKLETANSARPCAPCALHAAACAGPRRARKKGGGHGTGADAPARAGGMAFGREAVALLEQDPPQLVQIFKRLLPQLCCRPCTPCLAQKHAREQTVMARLPGDAEQAWAAGLGAARLRGGREEQRGADAPTAGNMGLPSLSVSGNDTKKSSSPVARGGVAEMLRAAAGAAAAPTCRTPRLRATIAAAAAAPACSTPPVAAACSTAPRGRSWAGRAAAACCRCAQAHASARPPGARAGAPTPAACAIGRGAATRRLANACANAPAPARRATRPIASMLVADLDCRFREDDLMNGGHCSWEQFAPKGSVWREGGEGIPDIKP